MTGGCKCKVGFEPEYEKQTCTVCPAGTFRSVEVSKCTPCPINSKATNIGSAFCSCKDGYYRHPRDGKHMPCYKPPGPPTNLTLLFMDQTSAILAWNLPVRPIEDYLDNKYRSNIVFRVKCPSCNSNVVFNPSTETFNDTKLTLTNLEPVTTYIIQVHTLNGISYSVLPNGNETITDYTYDDKNGNINAGQPQQQQLAHGGSSSAMGSIDEIQIKTEYSEITFTTESAVQSTVFNIRIIAITSKEADLSWDKALHTDLPIDFYEVRWFPKSELDSINKTTLSTKDPKAHIDNLVENTEYGFQVRCKTSNGWGTFSNIVYAQTHQSVSPGKNM